MEFLERFASFVEPLFCVERVKIKKGGTAKAIPPDSIVMSSRTSLELPASVEFRSSRLTSGSAHMLKDSPTLPKRRGASFVALMLHSIREREALHRSGPDIHSSPPLIF